MCDELSVCNITFSINKYTGEQVEKGLGPKTAWLGLYDKRTLVYE